MARPNFVTVTSSRHHDTLVSGLWNFFRSSHRADFEIQWGGQSIGAHQLILDVFLSPEKFIPEEEENVNEEFILGEGKSSMDLMMEFLYKGKVKVPKKQLKNLLDIAKEMDFKMLAESVEFAMANYKSTECLFDVDMCSSMPLVRHNSDLVERLSNPPITSAEATSRKSNRSDTDTIPESHFNDGDPEYSDAPDNDDGADQSNDDAADDQSNDEVDQSNSDEHSEIGLDPFDCATSDKSHDNLLDADEQEDNQNGLSRVDQEIISNVAAKMHVPTLCDDVAVQQPESVSNQSRRHSTFADHQSTQHQLRRNDEITPTRDGTISAQTGFGPVPPIYLSTAANQQQGSAFVSPKSKSSSTAVDYSVISNRSQEHAAPTTTTTDWSIVSNGRTMNLRVRANVQPANLPLEPPNQMSANDKSSSSAMPSSAPSKSTTNSKSRPRSGKRPYQCQICNKTFKRTQHLNEHTLTHTKEKPFKCEICSKAYSQSGALIVHMRRHTGVRAFKCSVCDRAFMERGSLEAHSTIHTGEKPYSCDECGKCFRGKKNLENHRWIHTSNSKVYKCEQCPEAFSQPHLLKLHKLTHSGQPPRVCHICGLTFADRHGMNNHKRVHESVKSDEKQYQCATCGLFFRNRVTLKHHGNVHTGAKPFKCDRCPKAYSRPNTLRYHIQTAHLQNPQ